MKQIRRILAMVLIMVMALTALPLTASAGIADTAKSISSGQTVQGWIPNENDCEDYKITVKSSGKLVLDLSINLKYANVYVYDENGNRISLSAENITSGGFTNDYRQETIWNNTVEKFNGKLTYKVNAGSYYIRIKSIDLNSTTWSNPGSGEFTLKATYPSTAAKAKISYISVTMSKGSTLQLGAVVSPSSSKVKWTSSKTSVATVSSSGKITAKAKGATIITAKSGSSTKKIRIVVK